ncbi:MAG: VWA domain-containing protein [Chthonomonas sp.]|nr:VWA domain-containing protein [Chthonomonas sp.]
MQLNQHKMVYSLMMRNKVLFMVVASVLTSLSLTGCKAVKDQLSKDMDRPTQPTTEAVAADVYLDLSGSTNSLRAPIATLIKDVLDTHPKTMRVNYSTFNKDVRELGNTLNAGTYLDEMGAQWEALPKAEPRGTLLGGVFEHAAKVARRDTSIKRIVVIGTDGGFEDNMQQVFNGLESLVQAGNLQMIVFVGVQPGNSAKLNKLSEIADYAKNLRTEFPVQVVNVLLSQNSVAIADAQRGIKELMEPAANGSK